VVSPITPGNGIHLERKALKSTALGTERVIPQDRGRNGRRAGGQRKLERLQVREKPLKREILNAAAG